MLGEKVEKSESKNLIFFNATTQFSNLGDLIINKTLLIQLRQYGQLIVNVKGVPEWYREQLEISLDEQIDESRVKFRYLVVLLTIQRFFQPSCKSYYVTNPGHIYGGVSSPINTAKSLIYFLILNLTGVRICSFGVSIGPFTKTRQIVECLQSKLMYFYSLRDSISETYARQIGINRAEHFPDLAWLMEKPKSGEPLLQTGDEYVVFSFRASTHSTHENDAAFNYKAKLFETLDQLLKLIYPSKKLVIAYQVSHDYGFCKEVWERYGKSHSAIFIEDRIDSSTMNRLYSNAAVVFSNRLHVLVFAMACGALPVAVIDAAKHDKITGIFIDAQIKNLIVSIDGDQSLEELVNQIFCNSSLLKQRIEGSFQERVNFSKQIFERVFSQE